MHRHFVALLAAACAAGLSLAGPAWARAPGSLSLGIDRFFGFSRTTTDFDPGGTTTGSSISFLGRAVQAGYSSPRLSFDYITGASVSFGGGLGYQSTRLEDDDVRSQLVLAPRIGYFVRATRGFALWPRGGITFLTGDLVGLDDSATALTFELPLVFLVRGNSIGLQIMPHGDIGVAGGRGAVDYTLSEIGVQLAVNLFL